MISLQEKEARRDQFRVNELITVPMSFYVPFGFTGVNGVIAEFTADQDLELVGYDADAAIGAFGGVDISQFRQYFFALALSFSDNINVFAQQTAMNTSIFRKVAPVTERIVASALYPQRYNGRQLRRERTIYGLMISDLVDRNSGIPPSNVTGFRVMGNLNLIFAPLEVSI